MDKIGLNALNLEFCKHVLANTVIIDTTNSELLNDDDIVNRIKKSFANFKNLSINGAHITINDKDPDNITIDIKGSEINLVG